MKWVCEEMLNHPSPFHMKIEELHTKKLKAFQQAFCWHYNNCSYYRRYCDQVGIKPNDIKRYDDLVKIPLIPSDAFREFKIFSVPEENIVLTLTSSTTTSKEPCKFPLDGASLRRMMVSNAVDHREVGGLRDGSIFMLTPHPKKSKIGLVTGFYKMIKAMGFKDEDIYFLKEGSDFRKLVRDLTSEDVKRPRHLYGPTFIYPHLLNYLEKNNIRPRLDEGSRVMMGGGWKGREGKLSKADLYKGLSTVFGISENQIRDTYGITDIQVGMIECEYHKTHVPPWIHLSARDPQDLNREVGEGEEGVLACMSSLIQSYPAFTLPGDVGVVWEEKCDCGRTGQIVEHRGRVRTSGARGCALRLEDFVKSIG